MRILSWNINGLRSLKVDMKEFLDGLNADIICFQETKITRDMLEESLALVDGYCSFFSFSKKRSGYSGVATFCKKSCTPSFTEASLGNLNLKEYSLNLDNSDRWSKQQLKDLDAEGRVVITQHNFKVDSLEESVYLFNIYCPRVDPEKPERLQFKLDFYQLLRDQAAAARRSGSHVIIVGDINTSHKLIDHCDPEELEDFKKRPDRLFLDSFLLLDHQANGKHTEAANNISTDSQSSDSTEPTEEFPEFKVIDSFRYFHPNASGAFTCWNTKANARATNYGTRIDYVFCDTDFMKYVNDSVILPDVMGSDHCPVAIEMSDVVTFIPSSTLPRSCSKFYPEFQGQQQKLSSYFQNGVNGTVKDCENQSKRKHEETNSISKNVRKTNNKKQCTLNSFFIKKSKNLEPSDTLSKLDQDPPCEIEPSTPLQSKNVSVSKNNKSEWSFLMKGPPPPPLCEGHKEPAVLRTVKKKGANFNRQFYACAKGAGKKGDPNAQCTFFKWFN